ncbi:DUF4136 domain-containing protein [Algoriphagus sediminis]|uniref:DUF4136 domain-containing protein n=1 Tax=Algoriphagus sediminis TaxID=3057113 RepID=A0ABT7YE51_9BACT|nr:DUF4136 domain-containing protein [Algoriphagus sediminis]MDN3204802.1 DUF4136 domain-containing protein [Algoriphagus sediminis]
MVKKYLVALAIAVFAAACGSTEKLSDQYSGFDLGNYKNYDFFEITGPENPEPGFEENIKFLESEISEALASRGLSQSSDKPELKLNLGIVVEDKVQTRTTSLATDPFMYSGQRSYTWESREVPVNTYKEGTLTMHIVDAATNTVVWAGTASRVLPKKNEKKQKAAQEAVAELFEQIDN